MFKSRAAWIGAAAACLVVGVATTAAGQQPAPADQNGRGPLVLEPMKNGFVVAPDAKVTKVAGRMGTLAGGYGGWVNDDHLLIGAGGYWLTSGKGGLDMGYGGLVVGWYLQPDRAVSFGVKGLVGFGQVSQPVTFASLPRPSDRPDIDRMDSRDRRLRIRNDFLVAEPELDVRLRLADRIHVTAGAGYRAIDGSRLFGNQVRGATGSVSVQVSLGK